jgi:hypothetical protein
VKPYHNSPSSQLTAWRLPSPVRVSSPR